MEVVNTAEIQDGDEIATRTNITIDTPSLVSSNKQTPVEGNIKKKRRRGKSKRKLMKPFSKVPWRRRRNDKMKSDKRYRTLVLSNTHAPFNNNQFLMEIHKPEPENNIHLTQTPSARTRDSSFSVDSEDNYFYSLPEDEEDFLTKEFSSVYEDAQSERLTNMSKNELIQEYLLLEAKFDSLVKRSDRLHPRHEEFDEDQSFSDRDTSTSDKESMVTDRETSETSVNLSTVETVSMNDVLLRVKEQEEQIKELKIANEKLQSENDQLRKKSKYSSSEDSESDSSSTSISSSSSSRNSISPVNGVTEPNEIITNGHTVNGDNHHLVNGFGDHQIDEN